MSYDYNLGAGAITLFARFEELHPKLDTDVSEIEEYEKYTDRMATLQKLILFLKKDSAHSKHVAYSHEGELSEKHTLFKIKVLKEKTS